MLGNEHKVLTDCAFLLALRVFDIELKHLNTTVRSGARTNFAFSVFKGWHMNPMLFANKWICPVKIIWCRCSDSFWFPDYSLNMICFNQSWFPLKTKKKLDNSWANWLSSTSVLSFLDVTGIIENLFLKVIKVFCAWTRRWKQMCGICRCHRIFRLNTWLLSPILVNGASIQARLKSSTEQVPAFNSKIKLKHAAERRVWLCCASSTDKRGRKTRWEIVDIFHHKLLLQVSKAVIDQNALCSRFFIWRITVGGA